MESDCSPTEKDMKQQLESIRQNYCKGPKFIPKNDDHTAFSPFHCVYKCGTNSNAQFTNATKRMIDSLFRKASLLGRVINYTRDEMDIALNNTKKTVPVPMLQEIHLPDQPVIDLHAGHDTDIFDDGSDTNTTLVHVNGDDIYDIHIKSTNSTN